MLVTTAAAVLAGEASVQECAVGERVELLVDVTGHGAAEGNALGQQRAQARRLGCHKIAELRALGRAR